VPELLTDYPKIHWTEIRVGDEVSGAEWYHAHGAVTWGIVVDIDEEENNIWISINGNVAMDYYLHYDEDRDEEDYDISSYDWYIKRKELEKSGFSKFVKRNEELSSDG
jgi:hypothetical protein